MSKEAASPGGRDKSVIYISFYVPRGRCAQRRARGPHGNLPVARAGL